MRKLKLFSPIFITICMMGLNAAAQLCGPFSASSPDDCEKCASLDLPKSTIACPGVGVNINPSVLLPTGFSMEGYYWTPPTGVSTASGWGMPGPVVITPPAPAGGAPLCGLVDNYYTLNITALAQDMVVNGDFSLGNTDFCSTLSYVAPGTSSTPVNMISPPSYTVCDNAHDMSIPVIWPCTGSSPIQLNTFAPHGTCPNMLLCYGDPNAWVYWQQTVWVCEGSPNTAAGGLGTTFSYLFNYWQATLTHNAVCSSTYTPVNSYVSFTDQWGGVTLYGPFTGIGALTYDTWYPVYVHWTNTTHSAYVTIAILANDPVNYGPPWGSLYAFDDIHMRRECQVKATTDIVVDYSSVTGPSKMCVGDKATFTPCTAGGTWNSSNPPVASIDPSGTVTALTAGTTIISYTDIYGCTATELVTVNPIPIISGGPGEICYNYAGPISLSAVPSGGTWSAPYFTPTAGPSPFHYAGPVWGGDYTITYTSPAGCVATYTETVDPAPDPMWTPYYICIGDNINLTDYPAGGTWTSLAPWIATITPGGFVTGVSGTTGGSAVTMVYTTPCGTATATVYVYDCSSGVIVGGGGGLCSGSGTTLIGLPTGGTWTSSNTTAASIDPVTGFVIADPYGTLITATVVTFTYTAGSIVITTTLTIQPSATACVTTACCDYTATFTSNCSTTPIIYYVAYAYGSSSPLPCIGGPPCVPTCCSITPTICTATPGTIPWSTVTTSFPAAWTICVIGLDCNGCWFPASCCAGVNPLHKEEPGPGTTSNGQNTEEEIKIIPNPNNGVFALTGSLPGTASAKSAMIEITNLLGQTVFTNVVEVNNGTLNTNITLGSDIANGVYLVKVKNGDASKVIQFILNR